MMERMIGASPQSLGYTILPVKDIKGICFVKEVPSLNVRCLYDKNEIYDSKLYNEVPLTLHNPKGWKGSVTVIIPYLFNDISNMQQSLLVYHTPMEDAGYHQLTSLHLECHPLKHNVYMSVINCCIINKCCV